MAVPTVKLPIDSSGDSSTVTVSFPFADLLNGDTLLNSQAGLTFTSWSPPNQPGVTFGSPTLSGTNWINDVTITGAKAGKTFLCYCKAETVGGQNLISQVNVQTTGVNPLANSPVTPTVPAATPLPNIYLPDGWDTLWRSAKATIATQPVGVAIISDSILFGGTASDPNSTGVRSLLRSKLMTEFGTYCDFFTNFNGSFTGWTNQGSITNERWGFGYLTVPSGSGGSNAIQFSSPYPCTQIDILYYDSWPGTWSYNLDGAGNTIVANLNQNSGNSATSAVKRLTLSGLANTTHTLVFSSQSASFTCAILGVTCYPTAVGGGIAFAPLCYAGTLLTDKISTYAFNAPSPQDMCWLFQGASPLCFNPGQPAGQITATAGTGGSVDVGTHYYAATYYGGFGETAVGTSTSAAVVVGSGNQTISVANIVNSAQQTSDCPYNAECNKNLYRTKASGTGTPGSGTNPWYFLAKIANGTTTYTDTTADASLTNQQPPASQFTWTPAGVFGFPTAPHLAIIGMGANDLFYNYSATNVANYELALKRLIRAIRRGRPGASILIFCTYMPDMFASDGGYWSSNSVYWSQYVDMMYRVASAENCALVNNDARWQCNAVANGFVAWGDVHPNDAGNADELVPLVGALGL